jgi:ABC-type phosphate transport system substrate-binding protein
MIGAVLPVALINVGSQVLDSDVLAQIFMGAITTWADPAILALNANLTRSNLPDVPITMSFTETLLGTAGSQVFKEALSIFNSTVAQRLSEAGGLFAGLPPFAEGRATQTVTPADRIA